MNNERPPKRWSDRWITYAAIIGPFIAFMIGKAMNFGGFVENIKQDHKNLENVTTTIKNLESFKETQEQYNQKTTDAIDRMNEILHDLRELKPRRG